MNISLAFGLCFAAGYSVVSSAWTQEKSNKAEWFMKLFLSAGFGIGIFSVTFFVDRLLGIVHILATDLGLTALLLVVYLLARARRTSENSVRRKLPQFELPNWIHRSIDGLLHHVRSGRSLRHRSSHTRPPLTAMAGMPSPSGICTPAFCSWRRPLARRLQQRHSLVSSRLPASCPGRDRTCLSYIGR